MALGVPVFLPSAPGAFVLLDDARLTAGAVARLYRDAVDEVVAWRPDEVRPALEKLRHATARGLHAAGYLHYEAGYTLEPVLAALARSGEGGAGPLLWFGLFADCALIPAADVPALLPGSVSNHGPARPMPSAANHAAAVEQVLTYIRAGDIYQANLTFRANVAVPDNGGMGPLATYAAIRPRAAMGHGALIRHDGHYILSFSPELFFRLTDGVVETLPMKGTAPRHPDAAVDAAAIADLCTDPKQRAENLMIVDLLRNDLSRVCAPGSVAVPDLFTVETYPTVHQMTSRVTGQLSPGLDAIDALIALFPCGSITGAPKIRAMQIIAEIEGSARGIYTGSIGSIDPDGNARFNVAIRTICVNKGAVDGVMGIGSGIVADSDPAAEWLECLDKARFLERAEGEGMQGMQD